MSDEANPELFHQRLTEELAGATIKGFRRGGGGELTAMLLEDGRTFMLGTLYRDHMDRDKLYFERYGRHIVDDLSERAI